LIALDEGGKSVSSQQFAALLSEHMNRSTSTLVFAIGGPYGWAPKIKDHARETISLSPLTYTSQMARLILIEQIYRAMRIIKGDPYHK